MLGCSTMHCAKAEKKKFGCPPQLFLVDAGRQIFISYQSQSYTGLPLQNS